MALVVSCQFAFGGQAFAQLISTPYPQPSCTANDANITAVATNTLALVEQCTLPTDTATVEYNITYTQNANSRYDLILGVVYNGDMVVHDFFSDVRTGGANDFLDLDGEADHGDYSSVAVSDVIVEVQFPCDLDGDGALDLSPTVQFAMGYNAAKSGSGSPSEIEGPKCALSNPVSFPLTTSITVEKVVINDDGGTSTVSDFGISTDAGGLTFDGGVTSGSTTTYTSDPIPGLQPGTYSLTELDLGNYTEGSWSCDGGTLNNVSATSGSVTIASGDNIICTISNNDTGPTPPSEATLTLLKAVTNDNGGTAAPGDWTLAYAGATSGSGATGTANVTNITLAAGSYTLSETGGPAGYTLTGIVCSGSDADGIDGVDLVAGENVTCTFTNDDDAPTGMTSVAIEKGTPTLTTDADSSGNWSEGDTITYVVTATNDGTLDLTNVVVEDLMLTPTSETCATVTPTETCVLTGTYILTQADVDSGTLSNTASVESTEITTPVETTVDSTITAEPALSAVKSAANLTNDADGNGEISEGDVVEFTITMTNDGNVTLNNVNVEDTLLTPSLETCAAVAPGATCVLTGSYTVTAADVTAGSFDNTASVTSTEVAGPTDSNTVTTPINTPAMALTKGAPTLTTDADANGDISEGDVITYTVSIENTGTAILSNVVVEDTMLSPTTETCATLAPGAFCTLTGTYTVTAADVTAREIVNTATGNSDQTPAEETASNTQPLNVPSLTFTKTADDTTDVTVGQTITYSYTAVNNGNVTMQDVTVTDVHSGANALSAITPASVDLLPGESQVFTATYVVAQADIDAASDITNTATLNANPASGSYSPLTATETVDVADAAPSVTLTKTADDTTDVVAGQTITYSYELINNGNVSLSNISLSDAHNAAGTLSAITPATLASLAPGDSQIFTATYEVTQADIDAASDITNLVTLSATPATGTLPVTTANETVDVADAAPSMTFVKEADQTSGAAVGDTITYSYTASNTGNITINAVSVSDVHGGQGPLSAITPASVDLEPGDSQIFTATYVILQEDIDAGADISNTATLAATPLTGSLPPLTATETVSLEPQTPDVTFDKSASMTSNVGAGEVITYTYTLENIGNVTLDNVSVSDVHGGSGALSAITPAAIAVLAPGDSAVFTANYTITQADVDAGINIENTATLSATPRTGTLPTTQAFESVDLVDPAPQLSLVKTADITDDVFEGQLITYSYTVRNTGNVSIMGATVTDVHSGSGALSAITPAPVDLTPGMEQIFTATYTVTQADIDAGGDITNTATATGTPMDGMLADVQAIERISPVAPMPAAVMTKTADITADVSVGDTVTYTYFVENIGNVSLNNVSLTDAHSGSASLSAITPASVASLAPGDNQTFTATYVITQDDIDAGADITNTATLNATPADGTLPPVTASESVDLDDVNPDFIVSKTASDTVNVAEGDVITYTYTLENIGNVTLSNISVSDVHSGSGALSAISPANVASLPIGQTATFTASYTVTQADIDAAVDITNTATFNASSPAGALPSETAAESVDVDDAAPEITFAKTASDTTNVSVGDEITYTYTARNTGNVSLTNIAVSDVHNGSGALSAISPANVASLAIGDTATFTANYVITQADIDAGVPVTNTATVTATPAAGTLAPTTDDASVTPEAAAASMTFAKSAVSTDFAAVGDVLDYEYLVTNTGNVTITTIAVTDDKIASVSCPVTTLAPAASVTCTASYSVTQDDLDAGFVTNNASAAANSPAGAVPTQSDQATVNGTQSPAMTIAKSALDSDFAAVNDALDYEYVVTNTGNVEITAISVTDDKIASVSCPITTLAPTQSTTCTASYSVTQADIDAGFVTNNASVDGAPAGGTLTPPTDSATVNGTQTPALDMVKTAITSSFAAVNEPIEYEYLVTNTGNTTITTAISVSDDKILPPAIVSCPALPAGGLLPMGTLTCAATYSVTQADLDAGFVTNVASASDGTVTSPLDEVTVNGVQSPALTLDKAAIETSFAAVGDEVNYSYTVTNTGNVLVSDLVVTDDLIAAILCNVSGVGNSDSNLDPGESVVCTGLYEVTQADLDAGFVTNNATLSATPSGGALTPPTDSETVNADQMPALTMVKTANETTFAAVGDVLTYEYLVTNTGNVLIADLAVSDDKIASVSCDVAAIGNNDVNLDPTEFVTCTASYSVTQADLDAGEVTNIASATGTPSGGALTDAPATATVDADQQPAMEVVKTATDVNFELPGDITTYEYVVTNTGNTTLTDAITVTDNLVAVSCPALPAGGLAPMSSLTCTSSYTVTQADLDNGSVTNLASAQSGALTSPQTSETIPADQDPALSIVKRAISTDFAAAGDVLSYAFDVTNTGNLTLTGGVDVIDDKIGTISCISGNLVPADTQTCSATYVVTQADMDAGFVTNQAFAQNGALTSPIANATVNGTFAPSLSFDKRAVDTVMNTAGDILTYEYDVENTGNVTISGLSVSDDKIASVSCPVTTLAPGAMTTCTASYSVTQADINAGSVTNNASVDGTPAGGSLTPPVDSETVTADQTAELTFVKRAIDTQFTMAGDVLDYEYDVTNSGNISVSNIVVTDDLIAVINCPRTTLQPTRAMTCQGSYTVTQADVDAGSVTNIAGVDATPAGGTFTPPTDTVTVDGDQSPRLTLLKQASAADFTMPGETISYSYTVTNAGNITINDLAVTDDKIASVSCPVTSLIPGAQTICTADYVTTQDDVDAGFVTNIAQVDGAPLGGALTPATATETVNATQSPELTLVKTPLDTEYSAVGDSVSYSYLVTNSGNTTVTDRITIADDKIANVSCPALPNGGLVPAASLTCSGTYIVTQADIDAGSVTNIAAASDGNTASDAVDATVNAIQAPSLAVVKTAQQSSFASVGDVVAYDYVVTNDGNVTITAPITISDDKIASVSCPILPAGGLAPAASLTCSASYSVTQADIDAGSVTNLASASDGSTVSPVVSETVSADQSPALSVDKVALDSTFAAAGDLVDYRYDVTNSGNVTLTDPISITDDKIASVSCPILPAAGLAPNATLSCTATYAVTQGDIDAGFVTNIAAASSGAVTSSDASETVTATQDPALTVTKTARDTRFDAVGDVITYDYLVHNSGNVTLGGSVSIADDRIASVNCPALPMGGLIPGAQLSCTASYLITQEDLNAGLVTNIASATASAPDGTPVTSPDDSATANADQAPNLTVIKTAAESTYRVVGDTLTYSYLVTNSGNVTLTAPITVSDDKIASVSCPALPAGGLMPSASITCSATYSVTQADLDAGSVVNIATASDGTTTSAPVTERVMGTRLEGLETVKTATSINFTLPGDIVTYEYVVTNTGNVTITNPISVTDNRISNVSCPALPAGGLLPTDSITCSANYIVTQDDLDVGVVTNVASATDGNVTSALTSETVPGNVNPAMAMRKTSTDTSFAMVGDVLSYDFEIENTGNVTLTGNIEIVDNKIGRFTCFAGNFIPGQINTCSADYTVTQADIDAGFVTNDAFAEHPRASSPPDFVTINADQMAALSMVKTATTPDYAAVGDVISYEYEVTNTGNTTITFAINVTDDKIASVSCPALPAQGLAPTEGITCQADYSVTQADIDAGSVTNIATATDGFIAPVTDSETVNAVQTPSLSVAKLAQSNDFAALGDVLSYNYIVTNNGNVTITAPITVTDDKIAAVNCPSLPAGGLLPNAQITCMADYAVTQADLDVGFVTNIASASDGTTTSPDDAATITGTQTPQISVVKTARESSFAAPAEIITYDYVVTNDGNVTLTAPITVSDDKIASVTCPALPSGGLIPTASLTCSASYEVTQADVDAGFVTNIASASDGVTTSPEVSETVTAAQAPQLRVEKTALTTTFAAVGDVIDYRFEVFNAGNTTIITPISIADDRIGAVSCPALPSGGLIPGASVECLASDSVTQADLNAGLVTNIATATDGTVTSAPISETVNGAQTAALSVAKIATVTNFNAVGDVLSYEYVVTNSGNVTLSDPISVADDKIAAVSCPALPVGGLVPNDTITCTADYAATQADLDAGFVTNIATATDGTVTSAPVDATVTGTRAPALSVDKTVAESSFDAAGDVLNYSYVVTNIGNTSLTSAITVNDDKIASVSCPALPSGGLIPMASITCSAPYSVTQADVDAGSVTNIASASDGTTVSPDVSLTLNGEQSASLTLTKRAVTESFAVLGDVLSYEYDVLNSGNVTVTEPITVIDDKIASVICPAMPAGGLAPSAVLTCAADYTVTQADVDAGFVTNIASASDGTTVSPDDEVTVDAVQDPMMVVTKTVSDLVQVGGPIYDVRYTLSMENTGNVTLTSLGLTDDLATVLAPSVLMDTPVIEATGFDGTGSANSGFDGAGDINLLSGDNQLMVGNTGVVTIDMRIDTSAGGPALPNTAIGSAAQLGDDVPSNDPNETPGIADDVNPTPLIIVDSDGDGVPDIYESASGDRDGDGIPDNEDYDPTGYFYCEETGDILSGGAISVSGPNGVNASIGTANDITIVQDGSNGFFQFYVTAAGRYTIIPTYPATGVPSTDRPVQNVALDVTTFLPSNPAILGSSEVGSSGVIADFSRAANDPYYFEFDIEAGDPAVLMNNIPLKFCGAPSVSAAKTADAEPAVQDDGRHLVSYTLSATNAGETLVRDINLTDDLGAVFGPANVEVQSVSLTQAPLNFTATANAAYNGTTTTALLTEGGELLPGETVAAQITALVNPTDSGAYENVAVVTASAPLDGAELTATGTASVQIDTVTDASRLTVTKTAQPRTVQIGDPILYTVSVQNETISSMGNLRITDRLPAGFSYIPGSSTLTTETDTIALEPTVQSRGVLTWDVTTLNAAPFNGLGAGEQINVNLRVLAGPSVTFGAHENRAFVESLSNGTRSDVATAIVDYIPEPTFDCTPVIGRVFDDVNHNGYPDDGEPGLPSVRLVTVNGDIITTDEHGRYHIPCAIIADNERGSNFLLKTDVRSLPIGYAPTSENPRVVRATRGKFVKMNFAAAYMPKLRVDLYAADFDGPSGKLLNVAAQRVFNTLASMPEAERAVVIYHAAEEEGTDMARSRLELSRQYLMTIKSRALTDIALQASWGEAAEYNANILTAGGHGYTHPHDDERRIDRTRLKFAEHEAHQSYNRDRDHDGARTSPTGLRGDRNSDDYDDDTHAGLPGRAESGEYSSTRPSRLTRWIGWTDSSSAYADGMEIETTVTGLDAVKRLNAGANIVSDNGQRVLIANAYWNYDHFIERAEIRLFEESASTRSAPVTGASVMGRTAKIDISGLSGEFKYVLRAYAADGSFDETAPKPITIGEAEFDITVDEAMARADDVFGADTLLVDNIRVRGGAVRVYGRNVPGLTATVFGQAVKIDEEGRFVAESLMPTGQQGVDIIVDGLNGKTHRVMRSVNVKDKDTFFVGLIEATIGERVNPDAEGDRSYAEGRAAFYVRSRINDRYSVTATADTGEGDIDGLLSNLDQKDVRHLLRRLDPDRYYPVYGDDSVIEEDAPTSGKFYARVERDDDYALWGNYRATYNDTEFGRVNRTLYGAKLRWDSNGNPTKFGDDRSVLEGYIAEGGSRAARDELRGTGGSVYYLRNGDINIGGEIVTVEIRDEISGLVVETRRLTYGTDYDIDYIQGRILLSRPLASTGSSTRLFRNGSQSGNAQILVVDYEYTPILGDDDSAVYGLRGSHWIGDTLKIGATYNRDSDGGADSELFGLDATLQFTAGTYIKAEIAQSEGRGVTTFRSNDGGFSYRNQTTLGTNDEASAFALEAAVNFAELGFEKEGSMFAYLRQRDAGFAGYGEGSNTDVTQFGGGLDLKLSETLSLNGRADISDDQILGTNSFAELSVEYDFNDITSISGGLAYSDDGRSNSGTAVALRASVRPSADTQAYIFGQVGVSGDNNRTTDRIGLGAETRVSEKVSLGGEVSTGEDGLGATASVRYSAKDGDELYLAYELPLRSNIGDDYGTLNIGARRRYTDALSVYGEERFHYAQRGLAGLTHAYGLNYAPKTGFSIGFSGEYGEVEDLERLALSANAGFKDERMSAGIEGEYRTDENSLTGDVRDTWLLRTTALYKPNDELRLQGKYNMAFSDATDESFGLQGFNQAKFTEGSLAAAYRPIWDDRLNVLAKYVYLEDLSPSAQRFGGEAINYKQRSQITSIDASYDISERWTIGAKYGYRIGELTTSRIANDFAKSEAELWVGRLDWHVVNDWDALFEVRQLNIGDGVISRTGGLTGIYRHINDNAKIGGGLVWGGIEEEYLAIQDDDNMGWYLNVIGKF